MTEPTLPPSPAPRPAAAAQAAAARLAHLFRASHRRGLIHPLEHIVQQLRCEAPVSPPDAPR